MRYAALHKALGLAFIYSESRSTSHVVQLVHKNKLSYSRVSSPDILWRVGLQSEISAAAAARREPHLLLSVHAALTVARHQPLAYLCEEHESEDGAAARIAAHDLEPKPSVHPHHRDALTASTLAAGERSGSRGHIDRSAASEAIIGDVAPRSLCPRGASAALSLP